MHRVHYILLQAGSANYVSFVAIVGMLVLSLSMFIVVQALVNRNRNNVLQVEKDLMKERHDTELLRNKVDVQEATFDSLSKELHDNVGQILVTVRMLLGAAERGFEHPPASLVMANENVELAIEEIRSLSKTLNTEWLQQFDLSYNLNIEIERLSTSGVTITFEQTGQLAINNEVQFVLFRVIQEAVKNAIEHSGTSSINIKIYPRGGLIHCDIRDYGKGLNCEEHREGLGMRNMRQRIKSICGRIDWISFQDGASVMIELPINI